MRLEARPSFTRPLLNSAATFPFFRDRWHETIQSYHTVAMFFFQDNEHDGSRGLITGHAYSVTSANKVPTAEGTIDLLRIFNPWGATEWTGDWSDM